MCFKSYKLDKQSLITALHSRLPWNLLRTTQIYSKKSIRMSKTQFKMLELVLVSYARLQRIKAGPFNTQVKVCFSCRYYAHIIITSLELGKINFSIEKRKRNWENLSSRGSAMLQLQRFLWTQCDIWWLLLLRLLCPLLALRLLLLPQMNLFIRGRFSEYHSSWKKISVSKKTSS